jgi:predicted MPP superfamily phosphohydrolase
MNKKRHIKLKYKILIIVIAIISVTMLWSRYISTSSLVIREYKVASQNLPSFFDGMKVVQFTDLHYGRTTDKKSLEHFVEEANALKPDLVFFTGDLIDKDTETTELIKNEIISVLSKLDARIGKYAVRGNHDVHNNYFNEIIEKCGFINLTNKYDIIYNEAYQTIYIAGLDTGVSGYPDINAATSYLTQVNADGTNTNEIPKYKILIMHTPDTIIKVEKYNFDLVLAGHSHNGQVRLPYIGAIITPLGSKKYHEDHYKVNDSQLFISGGLGTSTISFRFFNKPSFNLYRLVEK